MPTLQKERIVSMLKDGLSVTLIAQKHDVSRRTIQNRFKKWNIKSSLERFNHSFFEGINTEDKAYWLGFIMADGCVSISQRPKVVISLKRDDANHLFAWHKSIQSHHRFCDKKDGSLASSRYSKKMCNDLIALGCVPRKSLILQFPTIQKNFLHHFVRGYFDGDGCASWHNKNQPTWQLRLTFIGTRDFLQKLQSIVGVTNKLFPTGKAWAFQIGGNKQAKRVCDWMYKYSSIYLGRKREVCYPDL